MPSIIRSAWIWGSLGGFRHIWGDRSRLSLLQRRASGDSPRCEDACFEGKRYGAGIPRSAKQRGGMTSCCFDADLERDDSGTLFALRSRRTLLPPPPAADCAAADDGGGRPQPPAVGRTRLQAERAAAGGDPRDDGAGPRLEVVGGKGLRGSASADVVNLEALGASAIATAEPRI